MNMEGLGLSVGLPATYLGHVRPHCPEKICLKFLYKLGIRCSLNLVASGFCNWRIRNAGRFLHLM